MPVTIGLGKCCACEEVRAAQEARWDTGDRLGHKGPAGTQGTGWDTRAKPDRGWLGHKGVVPVRFCYSRIVSGSNCGKSRHQLGKSCHVLLARQQQVVANQVRWVQ
jgi:hypothetical protein